MKSKSYVFKVKKEEGGLPLIEFLAQHLPEALGTRVSKSKIRMLIFAGTVYVDGKRMLKVSQTINAQSEVTAHVDLKRLQNDPVSRQKKIELTDAQISYEDKDIIVVNKPNGIPTQATVDNARDHLFAAVIRYLSLREGREVYVGLHHRLDFDTSGLILFTKKKIANAWVADLFKNRKIQKVYHAIARRGQREVGDTWEIKNHLARAKNKSGGRVIHMEEVNSGGDFAHTTFKVLKNIPPNFQLIECQPHTGRTHQIRVHLQKSGQPILGDILYGGAKATRIFLHAKGLEFTHGGLEKQINVDSMYPIEMQKIIESS